MSDNVIYPTQFAGDSEHRDETDRAARRDEHAKKLRARNLARLDEIEQDIIATGVRPFSKSDRIEAARAVGAEVRRAKLESNVSLEQIKREVGARGGTDRIDRYMISTRGVETSREKALKKLRQKVSGYLRVVEAIAELTGQSSVDLKISVLQRTSLWSETSASQSAEDPCADRLAMLLNKACQSVARRSGLAKLFAKAKRIPGTWDLDGGYFKRSEMACLFQSSYLGDFLHWTEAPPLPSVPLVRLWQADFITKVRVEKEGRSKPLGANMAQSDDFAGLDRDASFRLYREIRLALGPSRSPNEFMPLFESRAYVTLRFADSREQLRKLVPDFTLKPKDDLSAQVPASVFQAEIDGLWYRVLPMHRLDDCVWEAPQALDDPFSWQLNPLALSDGSIEHWWLSWTPIHENQVKLWLDHPVDGNRVLLATPPDGPRKIGTVLFAKPSAAQGVERALNTEGLEKALLAEIERIRDALEQREKEWQEEISAATGDLLAEWATDRTGDEQ